jgi:hypothetical protein
MAFLPAALSLRRGLWKVPALIGRRDQDRE